MWRDSRHDATDAIHSKLRNVARRHRCMSARAARESSAPRTRRRRPPAAAAGPAAQRAAGTSARAPPARRVAAATASSTCRAQCSTQRELQRVSVETVTLSNRDGRGRAALVVYCGHRGSAAATGTRTEPRSRRQSRERKITLVLLLWPKSALSKRITWTSLVTRYGALSNLGSSNQGGGDALRANGASRCDAMRFRIRG